MLNIKTLVAGAGILAVLAGASSAHASYDREDEVRAEQSYIEARVDADACDTNYGEVVRVRGGFEAYCVPDDVAEGCIDVSSLLDCSLMSAEACDETMGSMFDACLTLQAGAR